MYTPDRHYTSSFYAVQEHKYVGKALKSTYYKQDQGPSNYYGLLALIAILVGIGVGYFTKDPLRYNNVAMGLVVAGILFWLLSGIVHGFGQTGVSSLGRLFGVMIFLGIGGLVLGNYSLPTFTFTNNNTPNNTSMSATDDALTVLPTTGSDTAIATENTASTSMTGQLSTSAITTGVVNTGQTTTATTSTGVAQIKITDGSYAHVVPAIVKKYGISTAGADVTLTYVPRTDPLYPYFKAGYKDRWFGYNINPSAQVSCNVYFVMLGLAQNWEVDTTIDIFTAYYNKAKELGQTYGCVPGAYVKAINVIQ